jgi:hypothetical protein
MNVEVLNDSSFKATDGSNTWDWEMHDINTAPDIYSGGGGYLRLMLRNAATWGGHQWAGEGVPFEIYYHGVYEIKP